MLRRAFTTGMKMRFYSTTGRALAEPAAAGANEFVINFCTPHAPVYSEKVVDSVTLPGSAGEYGVTHGHAPIISQLEAGVVTVYLLGGTVEKYFVPGGFAVTKADSVTDISVPEAVPVEDLDESAVRAAHAEATSAVSSSAEGSVAKATAMIEVHVASAMGRALGITL
mmetsp:Transcript_17073/g.28908  ORF Transcript_17073/g.28908 Transcript_17073/m.28908 type:complete len:168 (+) Transcript_17073:87-590(+)|eukprot:CAMPEP_0174978946 /NCGR_PEP_ID=MMETSP0004_2-20121128/14498_1 /TAXON_ID=420556 /ORGANISM="Ochromonas sp., Strain CCMP1393" /LENGTH=167 /DNA_ID=CAMNT_0016230399 /DNA_START=84 /DNA_END=587 /DNA_ORIENTATION=+